MYLFVVVGVGGIGGAVARDLPKLLVDSKHKILLIDGDVIEESNIKRQPFQKQDIKQSKARALAVKINSFYEIECGYYSQYIYSNEIKDIHEDKYSTLTPVIIGCVDNDSTRAIIEKNFLQFNDVYYIDGANSEYRGNIFSTRLLYSNLEGPLRSTYYQLDENDHPGEKSCTQQLDKGNTQFFITNNKIAAFMLQEVHAILTKQFKPGLIKIDRTETVSYKESTN